MISRWAFVVVSKSVNIFCMGCFFDFLFLLWRVLDSILESTPKSQNLKSPQ